MAAMQLVDLAGEYMPTGLISVKHRNRTAKSVRLWPKAVTHTNKFILLLILSALPSKADT